METTTLTLAEFLLARIVEDESAARLVGPTRYYLHDFPRRGTAETADGDVLQQVTADSSPEAGALFDHNARHQPGRVLAQCEAKRRIVSLHRLAEGPTYRGTPCCARCTADGEYPADDGYTDEQNWPCPTLRLLALPYADHPDYREEWRP